MQSGMHDSKNPLPEARQGVSIFKPCRLPYRLDTLVCFSG